MYFCFLFLPCIFPSFLPSFLPFFLLLFFFFNGAYLSFLKNIQLAKPSVLRGAIKCLPVMQK